MGLSRQEYWSGLPLPTPGDLPDPEIESESLASPSLAGGFFTTESHGKHHSWCTEVSLVQPYSNAINTIRFRVSPLQAEFLGIPTFLHMHTARGYPGDLPSLSGCASVLSMHLLHPPLRSFLHTSLPCWLHHPGSLGLLTSAELTPSWPQQEVRE